MASISWKNNASGNYDTAANWSTGTIPGAGDDVTINTSAAVTITKSTAANDKALSFYDGTNDTLAITGGSLQVIGTATVYGAMTESAGTFTTGGVNSYIYGNVTQTGGAIVAQTGTLTFTGTDSFAGTLSGSAMAFGGNVTILAGAAVNVGEINVAGGTLTLDENLSGSNWDQTGGALVLGTHTLSLSGAVDFDGGYTSGGGAINLSGATELYDFYFEGATTVTNTGTVDQTGFVYVGYNAGDTVKLVNAASGTYRIDGNSTISGPGGGAFVNAGTLDTSGSGITTIQVSLTDTGSINVASGELRIDGTTNSFAGTVSGAGTLEFYNGTSTLATGAKLTVKNVLLDGGTLTLGTTLSYAGNWNQTLGAFALGGHVITLTGDVALDGGSSTGAGTLAIAAGATAEVSNYYFEGSTAFKNSGVLTQDGYLYVGYNSGDTATFTNVLGAVWNLGAESSVYGVGGALVTNAGTLNKIGGSTSVIYDSFTNTGTINIEAGTLLIDGGANIVKGHVNGAGTLQLDAGNTTLGPATITVAHMQLDSGITTLGGNLTYAKDWEQTGGTLALNGHTLTLNGTGEFEVGVASGSGTIALKSGVISVYELTGSTVMTNTGTIEQTGYLYVGYTSGDTAQLINSAGATYKILADNNIYGVGGALITNDGTLAKSGGAGTAAINDSVNSELATSVISVTAGTLRLDGAVNNLAGTITGGGTLELSAGTDTIAGNTVATVSSILFDGATVSVGTGLSYAGVVSVSAGVIELNNGSGLSLTGSVNFDGGILNGTGVLDLTSTSEFDGFALEGSAVIMNTGTINQQGYWYLGYNSGDTPQLDNEAGGVLNIYDSTTLYSIAGAKLINAGLIDKFGSGTSVIETALTNTGTISVAGGYLRISGASSSLGGTITGGGLLELNSGTDTIVAGTALSVGGIYLDGASVTLSGAENYAGVWTETSGTLTLGSHTLTLSGATALQAGVVTATTGTLALSGATTLTGLQLEGSATLSNTGAITQNGYLYVGYNSGDTAELINQASGSIQITTGYAIEGTTGASFTNDGSFSKTGTGTSTVAVATINAGTVNVASGGMTFASAVSGAGSFTMGTGTTLGFSAAVAAGGKVTMGADSTLVTNTTAGFGDAIANFTAGDVISLGGLGYNSAATFAFNATTDKLVVTSGSSNATLLFSGSYTAANFVLFNNAGTEAVAHT